jgi:hypothetical protein
MLYILSFICLAARKLDKIQIYTKVYGYKIKNVLNKISNYEERVAEKNVESDYSIRHNKSKFLKFR